jgi:hypothetical protein
MIQELDLVFPESISVLIFSVTFLLLRPGLLFLSVYMDVA